MASKTGYPEAAVITQSEKMKSHYQMTKAECIAELNYFSVLVNPKDYTLPEMRVLVRENREHQGLLKPKVKQGDIMSMINNAKKDELKEMCHSRQVTLMDKPSVGEMRLLLKNWVIQHGTAETEYEIGKYKGMQFHEIVAQFPGYVEWACKEAKKTHECDRRLRQFVNWVEKVDMDVDELAQKESFISMAEKIQGGKMAHPMSSTAMVNKAGSSLKSVDTASQSSSVSQQMLDQMKTMMEKMEEMQNQLDEVKDQRKKSNAKKAADSDGSYEKVHQRELATSRRRVNLRMIPNTSFLPKNVGL